MASPTLLILNLIPLVQKTLLQRNRFSAGFWFGPLFYVSKEIRTVLAPAASCAKAGLWADGGRALGIFCHPHQPNAPTHQTLRR